MGRGVVGGWHCSGEDPGAMERKRWECPALPQGWEREEVPRRSGLSAGHRDVFYYR